MITHEEISKAVASVAEVFPLKQASYFGSYADGRQTESSDLDLLLEFHNSAVSLFTLSAIKSDLESLLRIPVDVIHSPVPKDSFLEIGKTVRVF
ncbi:MAG: nucleotidyltransferase domain-containing protein [Oscillospiraceae bacterium]|nr:nucleotidyltransferase domain-containing protein [Oscillospiraceae bacterium]